MRKVLLIGGVVCLLAASGLYLSFDRIVEHYARQKVASLSERLGHTLDFDTIEWLGDGQVSLTGLRVGPQDAPFLSVRKLVITLDEDALWERRAVPTHISIEAPRLEANGDGTLPGFARAVKSLIAQRDKKGSSEPKRRRALPTIEFLDGEIIDLAGSFHAFDGSGSLANGVFELEGEVRTPDLARCTVTGTVQAMDFQCERAYRRPLPGGLNVAVHKGTIRRHPELVITVPDVSLTKDKVGHDALHALISGLNADIQIRFPENETQWPLELTLRLPGGGEITGTGTASRDGVDVSARVENLEFGHAHKNIGGIISGNYRILASLAEGRVQIAGEGLLRQLTVEHSALADEPVGPFDFGFKGQLGAVLVRGQIPMLAFNVSDAHMTLGDVRMNFGLESEMTLESGLSLKTIKSFAEVPMVEASALKTALPKGLFPRLEPLDASGSIGLQAAFYLDMDDFDATRLNIAVPKKKFKITELNPDINFHRLRQSFRVSHTLEMSDGLKIKQSRMTGPTSKRWTPLDEMSPVLPAAVRSQEDWGFYDHPGISVFHLRGSVISNLKASAKSNKLTFRRGGSTMTMQLARNLFLDRRKLVVRKIEEIILAWLMEQRLDKDEMMALYLNVVELGPDIYGIGEAAEHYFEKTPKQLTPAEVAWIVRLLPGPRPYYLSFQKGKLTHSRKRRINQLLAKLVDRKVLTAEQAQPVERTTLWPNGTKGRAKRTIEGIPISMVKAARKARAKTPSP